MSVFIFSNKLAWGDYLRQPISSPCGPHMDWLKIKYSMVWVTNGDVMEISYSTAQDSPILTTFSPY